MKESFKDIWKDAEFKSAIGISSGLLTPVTPKDIANILVPSLGTVDYFTKLVRDDLESLDIPRSVSIVRWEDAVD